MPIAYSRLTGKCHTDVQMACRSSTAIDHCLPVKSWVLGCVDKAQFMAPRVREDSQPFLLPSYSLFRILHLGPLVDPCCQAFITVTCLCSSLWRAVCWYHFNLSCVIWCLLVMQNRRLPGNRGVCQLPRKKKCIKQGTLLCKVATFFPRCFRW